MKYRIVEIAPNVFRPEYYRPGFWFIKGKWDSWDNGFSVLTFGTLASAQAYLREMIDAEKFNPRVVSEMQ